MQALFDFWQQHFAIFNIVLPAITGFILILIGDPTGHHSSQEHQQKRRLLARAVSLCSSLLGLVLAIAMLYMASRGQIFHYQLSEWTAPFGIVLVVDRLSALMVLLTSVLLLPVVWYSCGHWDQRGRYFHAMVHFLVMGVCGAFLTGDLFNLFVFFEILLLASYVLFLHNQDPQRFAIGVQYVVLNLLASSIFLIGLGLIYANVGSLNMADVARLLPTLASEQHSMAMIGGTLLCVVFAIKAAIFPVGFWLPRTYAIAAAPIAALFTIMTKVGIYAILRVNGTVFSEPEQTNIILQSLLLLGILTSLYGVWCASGTDYLRRMIGFLMMSSVGTILIGISLFSVQAWAATLFYLFHSTLIAAAFYLFAEWLILQRQQDHLKADVEIPQQRLLSIVYFIIALMIAGLPPFSGFWGKVFLLQASTIHSSHLVIMVVILVASLLSIIVLVRNGFILFWQSTPISEKQTRANIVSVQHITVSNMAQQQKLRTVIYLFLAGLIGYVIFAEPIYQYQQATAVQLMDKKRYQDILLKRDAEHRVISTQPFDPHYVPYLQQGQGTKDIYRDTIPYSISPNTLQHQSEQQHATTQVDK